MPLVTPGSPRLGGLLDRVAAVPCWAFIARSRFTPTFYGDYLRWLKGTPWTVRKPLPLGPVELVPEDCLAICLLALLGKSLPDFTSLYIINLFLFAHTLAITTSLWKTGSSVYGYCAISLAGVCSAVLAGPVGRFRDLGGHVSDGTRRLVAYDVQVSLGD